MKPKYYIKILYLLIGVFFLLLFPVLAEEVKENILYKIELSNPGSKNISVKFYTAEKYQGLPRPIKKSDTGYILFLPKTREKLELPPLTNHLAGVVENIDVEYFPIANKDYGYTKVFIKTSGKKVELLVENQAYTPPETKKPEKIKEEPEITDNPKNEISSEEHPEKIEKETEQTSRVVKNTEPEQEEVPEKTLSGRKPVAKVEKIPEGKTTEKVIRDYSIGIIFAILLFALNLIFLFHNKKNKSKYDGKLSTILPQKLAKNYKQDYILIFSDNKKFIEGINNECRKRKLYLHIAAEAPHSLPDKIIENPRVTLSEFNFDEFYKHREFYRSIKNKPVGIIFDIDPRYRNKDSGQNFDFVSLKKHIDLNYTNLFLILELIIRDLNSSNSFIIFTDSAKKSPNPKIQSMTQKIYYSANQAIISFIENVKKSRIGQEGKILYCINDFNHAGKTE